MKIVKLKHVITNFDPESKIAIIHVNEAKEVENLELNNSILIRRQMRSVITKTLRKGDFVSIVNGLIIGTVNAHNEILGCFKIGSKKYINIKSQTIEIEI